MDNPLAFRDPREYSDKIAALIEKKLWDNFRAATRRAAIAEVRYAPGGRCGPRRQTQYQVTLLNSGGGRVTVDKKVIDLAVGTLTLMRPGHRELWEFSSDHETHHSWCEISGGLLPESMRRALAKAPTVVPVSPFWNQLLALALELRNHRTTAGAWTVESMVLALLGEFLHIAESREIEQDSDESVNRFVRYLREHLTDEDCLVRALAASGCSRNVLSRRFRATLETSPARFLWKLRTERGVALLRETGLTVAEIAYQCGFKNPFHFSRAVKNLQGEPPRQIRQKAWKQKEL